MNNKLIIIIIIIDIIIIIILPAARPEAGPGDAFRSARRRRPRPLGFRV